MMLHISALQSEMVMGRQLFRHSIHVHFTYHVPRGRKTLQTHGFLIQTYGKHSRGHTSYLKVKIKIPFGQIASFCSSILHADIKSFVWSASQGCKHYITLLVCNLKQPHTKQKKKTSRNHVEQPGPYFASRWSKRMRFVNNAHLRTVGGKHCKCMASTYKPMGKLQRAITLVLRCESKIWS